MSSLQHKFADLKNISNLERTCSSKRFMISKVLLTYFQGPLKNFFLSHTTEARRSLLKSSRQQNLWHWHIFSNNFTFFSILIKFWICSLLTFVNDWGWSDPAMFSYILISLRILSVLISVIIKAKHYQLLSSSVKCCLV